MQDNTQTIKKDKARALEMAKMAVGKLDEKKAQDIVVLELDELSTLTDFFIVSSGRNVTMVRALADELDGMFSKVGIEPRKIERDTSNNWILLDYGDIIIHVFYHPTRQFYNLEMLWGDAPKYNAEEFLKL